MPRIPSLAPINIIIGLEQDLVTIGIIGAMGVIYNCSSGKSPYRSSRTSPQSTHQGGLRVKINLS